MQKLFIFILFLFVACMENGNRSVPVNDELLAKNQIHLATTQYPVDQTFQTVDVEQFWNWAETDHLSANSVKIASDVGQISHQIELLEGVSQQLQSDPATLTEVEKLEYSFLTQTKLSVLHSRKAGLFKENEEKQENHIESSLFHQKKALSHLDQLSERDSAYRVDRAFPELELTSIECHQNPNRDCLERLLTIVETYSDRDLAYGPYPEWFVSSPVLYSVSYYFNQSSDTALKQDMFNELQRISNRNDVIGVSASLVMAKHYLTEGHLGTVKSILENPSVEINSLPEDVQIQWRNIEQAYQHYREKHSK